MEFVPTYTKEQEDIRKDVRAWLGANVPKGITDKKADSYERYLKQRELGRKLGEKGWLFPMAPKEYGGGGQSVDFTMILNEELDRLGLSLPPFPNNSGATLGGPCILVWGTEEQKKHFLPPMYRGEVKAWQLLTEPSGGSDLAGVTTTAIRDGDEYVLNGQKIFIGGSHGTEWMWTIAKTDPNGPRHHNLSWFMIDAKLPGITIQPQELLHSLDEDSKAKKNTIFLDNVRVPAFSLIGGENNGWRVASTHLELEHGGGGGLSAITRDRVWDELLAYCRQHQRSGTALTRDQDTRDLLAEIYIKSKINRLFRWRNFWLAQNDLPRSYEGSQSSYYNKIEGLWMTNAIVRAVGPAAISSDETWGSEALEDQQRRGIMAVHPGGTADIQRVIMSRRIGIGRTEREQAGVIPSAAAS